MRKSTLLWLVLAAFCSTVLFHTSQKVHDEREKQAALEVAIGKEQESIRVLNAEWSYLNQPARLEKLAKTYLNMAPLKGSQFIKVEDIPLRGTEMAEAAPVAVIKIKPKQLRHPVIGYSPKTVPGSKSASARLVNSHAAETVSWIATTGRDEQVRHGDNAATTATNTRSFNDLMKNLRSGVE